MSLLKFAISMKIKCAIERVIKIDTASVGDRQFACACACAIGDRTAERFECALSFANYGRYRVTLDMDIQLQPYSNSPPSQKHESATIFDCEFSKFSEMSNNNKNWHAHESDPKGLLVLYILPERREKRRKKLFYSISDWISFLFIYSIFVSYRQCLLKSLTDRRWQL